MAVKFKKLSGEERILIAAIMERAVTWYKENLPPRRGPRPRAIDIQMDVHAVHTTVGLRLSDMLAADNFNFMHDINGIGRHLNRETGKLEDCFLPRFASWTRPRENTAGRIRAAAGLAYKGRTK